MKKPLLFTVLPVLMLVGVVVLGVGCLQKPQTTLESQVNDNGNTADTAVTDNVDNTNTANSNAIALDVNEASDDATVEEIANTNESIDTSDWLTYTNEEYGFSFRYPRDWKINIEKTKSASWILPDANIYVIQLSLNNEVKLALLPEGQLDHGLNPDLLLESMTIDNKTVTLRYSDTYQVYSFNNYPKENSEFRAEANTNNSYEGGVIKKIMTSILFNS